MCVNSISWYIYRCWRSHFLLLSRLPAIRWPKVHGLPLRSLTGWIVPWGDISREKVYRGYLGYSDRIMYSSCYVTLSIKSFPATFKCHPTIVYWKTLTPAKIYRDWSHGETFMPSSFKYLCALCACRGRSRSLPTPLCKPMTFILSSSQHVNLRPTSIFLRRTWNLYILRKSTSISIFDAL